MTEELKDKIDAQKSIEERRQQLDEKYPEYVSKQPPANDMAQAESLGDSVPLEREWPRK